MSPALLALLISLVEELIKIEPALAAAISALLAKTDPTPADWQALRAKVLGESFESLAPNAAANLPTTQVKPAVTVLAASDKPAETVTKPVTDASAATPEVVCPVCQKVLVPDSPDNCNCPAAAPTPTPAAA